MVIVEAKKEDLKSGLGQCIAEMVAAQLFNQQNGKPIECIYGTVTSGKLWQFLKLAGQTVTVAPVEYAVPPVDQILSILVQLAQEI